jgi:hypothetical protein
MKQRCATKVRIDGQDRISAAMKDRLDEREFTRTLAGTSKHGVDGSGRTQNYDLARTWGIRDRDTAARE